MRVQGDRGRRIRWFERGVEAWRATTGETHGAYVCPCCLERFPREALDDGSLSLDHAPPRALGGRPVVLTCKRCNNHAGSELEHHMERLETHRSFLEGGDHRPLWVRVVLEGAEMNVELRWSEEEQTHQLIGDAHQNPPGAGEVAAEVLRRWVEEGADGREFQVRSKERLSPRRAAIGWMRSAYLNAFAFFGYRYILSSGLRAVREQVANPEDEIIEPATMRTPAGDRDARILLQIREPDVLRDLFAVVLGSHVILLPSLAQQPQTFATAVRVSRERHASEQMTGDVLRWAEGGPRYGLDFHRARQDQDQREN